MTDCSKGPAPLPRGLNARVCPYAHGQANARLLAEEPIIPLSLAAVVRVRLDRTATTISPLVIIGVRTDGQKILLTVKAMVNESTDLAGGARRSHPARLAAAEFPVLDGARSLRCGTALRSSTARSTS